MNKRVLILATLVSLQLFAAEQIKVGGGSGPMRNIFAKIQEPFKKATKIELVLSEDGPDKALADLDADKLEVASAGVSQDQWFSLMDEKKLTLKTAKTEFKFRTIGRDIIKVVIHKDLQVANLSKEQLKKLFSGEAKSWKDVGGPNVPVVVIIGAKIPGIYKFFAEKAVEGLKYTESNKKEATDANDVAKVVAATPGAIGLVSTGTEGAGAFFPVIPEIGRPIIAATKGKPSDKVLKLYDFIEKEGKNFVAK